MSLNREFLIWKEQGREVRERERGWAGKHAVIFKVMLGLVEIEGKDRKTRDRETELTIKITSKAG